MVETVDQSVEVSVAFVKDRLDKVSGTEVNLMGKGPEGDIRIDGIKVYSTPDLRAIPSNYHDAIVVEGLQLESFENDSFVPESAIPTKRTICGLCGGAIFVDCGITGQSEVGFFVENGLYVTDSAVTLDGEDSLVFTNGPQVWMPLDRAVRDSVIKGSLGFE